MLAATKDARDRAPFDAQVPASPARALFDSKGSSTVTGLTSLSTISTSRSLEARPSPSSAPTGPASPRPSRSSSASCVATPGPWRCWGRLPSRGRPGPGGGHAPDGIRQRVAAGVRVDKALQLVRRLYRHPAPFDLTVERAGIGPLLARQTQRLSGGQAQRVRFAIAIAGDPELVFLDEPTAAMDVESRRSFWRMMRQFGEEGRTIVFATHHLQEADQIADRVVVINHGRVVANGPGATLKAAVRPRQVRFVCDRPGRTSCSTHWKG